MFMHKKYVCKVCNKISEIKIVNGINYDNTKYNLKVLCEHFEHCPIYIEKIKLHSFRGNLRITL